jgi:hypothetical protein
MQQAHPASDNGITLGDWSIGAEVQPDQGVEVTDWSSGVTAPAQASSRPPSARPTPVAAQPAQQAPQPSALQAFAQRPTTQPRPQAAQPRPQPPQQPQPPAQPVQATAQPQLGQRPQGQQLQQAPGQPPSAAAIAATPEARRSPRGQGDETVLLRRLANSEQPRRTPGAAQGTTQSNWDPSRQPTPLIDPGWPPIEQRPESKPAATPPEEPKKRRRGLKILLFTLLGLVVVTLVTLGILWALSLNTIQSGGGGGDAPAPTVADAVISAADLATIGASSWTEQTDGEIPTPSCMAVDPDGVEPPQRTEKRGFVASDNPDQHAAHWVYTYSSDEVAAQAFQGRSGQAGSCPNETLQITTYYEAGSMADEGAAATFTIQNEPMADYRTVFFTRTGRTISVLDIGSPNGLIPPADVAPALLPVLNRLCAGGQQGTCPGPNQPLLNPAIPPATQYPGWLVSADLPRITLGQGSWGTAGPSDSMGNVGTACEPAGFPTVSGALQQQYASYILSGDANAPQNPLGIDEAVYLFDAPETSLAAAKSMFESLTTCQDRQSTATVTVGEEITGVGLNSAAIRGEVYQISQNAGSEGSKMYRVAVILVENRMAYLMANPTESYDFSEDQWRAIAYRAGVRLSQSQ